MNTPICAPARITPGQRISLTGKLRRHDLVEDLEWMLSFNIGEHELVTRTGRNAEALKTVLRRIGRQDLIPRIFEHDQQINERLGRA
jgi:hypothetical protein